LIQSADKIFSIYRSSAGSGKTRTLAREYLKLALKYKSDYYKHILAVTFTNKASQEMKDRILFYLDEFAKGNSNDLADELMAELKQDAQTFQQNSQAVQRAILHQYSQFSISTIDAFFQKVIRSFTRESGLIGDYRLEVDHDTILEEVIDNLIDELGTHKELTEWVVEFAKENLENERAWDVRYNLIEFAREIFREEFKSIEDDVLKKTREPFFFKNLLAELRKTKFAFIQGIKSKAQEALAIMHQHGLSSKDFKYAGGVYNLFVKASKITRVKDFDEKEKGKRADNEYQSARNWPDKATPHADLILNLAETRLLPLLNDIISYWSKYYQAALSSEAGLNNFYSFGLITDIARKLKEYKDENNVMLLADAPKFLNGVIQDSDTPFIYEKVGSFYRNYLIDEFQDTSGMQWKNFQPLIINSLDQGYPGLVVGDVKQAIYRWRGGDLNLLQNEIPKLVGDSRVSIQELDQNWRSAYQVVNFNNELFKSASAIVSFDTGTSFALEAYKDVTQQSSKKDEGFVDIRFLMPEETEATELSGEESESSAPAPGNWTSLALDQLPLILEELQLRGGELKDIAILVRKNEEGQQIAAHLLQYKNSGKAKRGCRYDVVSNESLRIDGAGTVNLLLGAMRYLLNADDAIARAQLGFEYARLHEPDREYPEVFAVANQSIFENNLPKAFTQRKPFLKKLSLIELTETLIDIFKLGKQTGELVYLQAFQDLVLEFNNREKNDLGAFMEWWEDNRRKKSVQISGEVNAAQILTIHKSKGLQFKYVIIPFCAWNMDHDSFKAPNLWVTSSNPPFKDAGYVPVRYGRNLEQTYFSEFYREEFTRCYLDNLNLLYVAFTRAEHGLIVTAPHPDIAGKISVASLLYKAITASDALKSQWVESQQRWYSGKWNISKANRMRDADALSLREYIATPWRDKLVIRQSGMEFFNEGENRMREKINYGIQMHAVLSRMRHADEIDRTLEDIILEGLLTVDEKPFVKAQLEELMEMDEVAAWFSRDWRVETEIPILLPDGDEYRIDRLILQEKKAIVIDFKTGDRKTSDHNQVLGYLEIMRQMNFIDVKGYLLYLVDRQVVEVKLGVKERTVKKIKDKDQLGLGF
jgi:ATP-dependent helicase/nuclease subunit A